MRDRVYRYGRELRTFARVALALEILEGTLSDHRVHDFGRQLLFVLLRGAWSRDRSESIFKIARRVMIWRTRARTTMGDHRNLERPKPLSTFNRCMICAKVYVPLLNRALLSRQTTCCR